MSPHIGYGTGDPDFWISAQTDGTGFRQSHIAFVAADAVQVGAFYDAALKLGLEPLQSPRLWPEYGPGYFAAFVRDPDGNNVEARAILAE